MPLRQRGVREALEAHAILLTPLLVDRVEVETEETEQEAYAGRHREQVAQRDAHFGRLLARGHVVAGHTAHTNFMLCARSLSC